MYENILKLAKTYESLAKSAQDISETVGIAGIQDALISSKVIPVKRDGMDVTGDSSNPLYRKLFNDYAGMVEDTTNISLIMNISTDGKAKIIVKDGTGKVYKNSLTVSVMERNSTGVIQKYLQQKQTNLLSEEAWNFLNFTIQF